VHAAIHMMGVPSSAVTHADLKGEKEKDAFWNQFRDSDRKNYVMMAGSLGKGEQESKLGIISGHAYSLIAVFEFQIASGRIRLVKLRNPWGKGEWKGDWSD